MYENISNTVLCLLRVNTESQDSPAVVLTDLLERRRHPVTKLAAIMWRETGGQVVGVGRMMAGMAWQVGMATITQL